MQTIRRTNRKTSFPIGVNLKEDADIEEVRMRVNSVLQTMNYPTGYGFTPPFDMDQLEDQSDMTLALLMSVVTKPCCPEIVPGFVAQSGYQDVLPSLGTRSYCPAWVPGIVA